MATPIGFTPQFVQTDLGLINQTLSAKDASYNRANQALLADEDAYTAFQVDPSDIGLKNQVLDKAREGSQKIIDRYGGDLDAASADLARHATSVKRDPFFALASEKKRLGEEERRLEKSLGPFARKTQSVRDISLIDEETGDYVAAEDLDYNVYDTRLINQELSSKLGKLGDQVREENGPARYPGYFTARTHKGVKSNELAGVADRASSIISDTFPGLSEEEITEMSQDFARSLQGGHTDDYIQDKIGIAAAAAAAKNKASKLITHRTTNSFKNETITDKDLIEAKFDDNGNLKPQIGVDAASVYFDAHGTAGSRVFDPFGEKESLEATSEKGRQEYTKRLTEKIAGIKQKFPQLNELPDAEAVKQYNDATKAYSAQSFSISEPSIESKKIIKDRIASNFLNGSFWLKTNTTGEVGNGTLNDLLDGLGYDKDEFDLFKKNYNENAKISGIAISGGVNPGDTVFEIPDKDGNPARILASADEDVKRLSTLSHNLRELADKMEPGEIDYGGSTFKIDPIIANGTIQHIITIGQKDDAGNFTPKGQYTLQDMDKRSEENLLNSPYLGTQFTDTKKNSGE